MIITNDYRLMKCDWPSSIVFQPNLKYHVVSHTNTMACKVSLKTY